MHSSFTQKWAVHIFPFLQSIVAHHIYSPMALTNSLSRSQKGKFWSQTSYRQTAISISIYAPKAGSGRLGYVAVHAKNRDARPVIAPVFRSIDVYLHAFETSVLRPVFYNAFSTTWSRIRDLLCQSHRVYLALLYRKFQGFRQVWKCSSSKTLQPPKGWMKKNRHRDKKTR